MFQYDLETKCQSVKCRTKLITEFHLQKAQSENNVDYFIRQTESNSQKSELEGKTTDCEYHVQVLD